MKIEISDDLSGKQRQKLLKYHLVKHALEINLGVKIKAADWLGISARTMRNWCNEFKEFSSMSKKIKNNPLWQELTPELIKFMPETFEECTGSAFYRFSSKEMEDEVKKFYELKIMGETGTKCEHKEYTMQMRVDSEGLVRPTRVCVHCLEELEGATHEEKKELWRRYVEWEQ